MLAVILAGSTLVDCDMYKQIHSVSSDGTTSKARRKVCFCVPVARHSTCLGITCHTHKNDLQQVTYKKTTSQYSARHTTGVTTYGSWCANLQCGGTSACIQPQHYNSVALANLAEQLCKPLHAVLKLLALVARLLMC
jgi:hypothetical protein